MTGGWAAKELCEKGLKTLVLERGRNIEHIKDYPTATKAPWELRQQYSDCVFKKGKSYCESVLCFWRSHTTLFCKRQ